MEYIVNFKWDNKAQVWIATSKDIPGLVLESGSFDALLERVRIAVPELLSLNALSNVPISLAFLSDRHVTVDTKIKSRHTANAIFKQSGINYKF